MRVNRQGCSRIVIELDKYVIKIPNFLNGWRKFLKGLIHNLNECDLYSSKIFDNYLCPIIYSMWGGWLNIMPKCKILTDDEFLEFNYADFIKGGQLLPRGEWILPVENKSNSFGWLNNQIVAIDYADET